MNRKLIKLSAIIIAQHAMIYTAIKVANRYSVWIGLAILYAIRSLELTCDHMGIDLMAHIDLKLKYNETRPALHGKKY